jgi:VanZ family protein
MNKKVISLAIGGGLIILGFLAYFISKGNFEFLGYAIVVAILLSLVLYSDKYINYPAISLWLFVIWIFLHFLGGALFIGTTRLYDLILIDVVGSPYDILRYDQVIHFYCYFAISILVYFISVKYLKVKKTTTLVLIMLSALGVSAINEIIEFGMVIWLDAAEAVGGYYNTMMDLVTNLIGAVLGTLVAYNFLDKK